MISKLEFKVTNSILEEALKSLPDFEKRITLNKPNTNFFYDPWVIKPEFKKTVWEDVLNSLPFEKGEARIIKLAPGESYLCHADIDNRWHLNLQGQQSYLVDLTEHILYPTKADGFWYNMNAGKLHSASNYGPIDRLQLVVRQLLQQSLHQDLVHIEIVPTGTKERFRYTFDNLISSWLNQEASKGNISNFFYDGKELVEFDLYTNSVEEFKTIITNDFKVTYA